MWQLRSHRTRSPRDHAVPDDLVGGRCTADDEEGLVGSEYARRIALAFGDRPGMIEQRSELADRDRNIGAKRVLAEELVKQVADGALAEGNAAAMPRVCQE